MFIQLLPLPVKKLPALLIGLLAFAIDRPINAQEVSPPPKEQESKPQLRVICVASLTDDQEVILASHAENGTWQEHATLKLRSSFISDWLPAHPGELDLALREGDKLNSICHFTYPEGAKRAIVVLAPDQAKMIYRSDVIDTGKLKFVKGSTLVINYSPLSGAVILGSLKTSVKPGERIIVKAQPDANGMYRMMAAYANANKELVPCYDRYVSSNPDARDILFLLPDPTLGLKVFSLSEFGPFD